VSSVLRTDIRLKEEERTMTPELNPARAAGRYLEERGLDFTPDNIDLAYAALGAARFALRKRGTALTDENVQRALRALDAGLPEPRAAEASAPDPYAPGIEKLRAAADTPLSIFERSWQRQRLDALSSEYDRSRAAADGHPTGRLTVAELRDAAAPDPYAEDLRQLRLRGKEKRS
jgi:hypothetical protein